jgi:hypothetical protein
MATISLDVARPRDVSGVRRRTIGRYTGPASYATGGESFTPGEVGQGRLEFVHFELATNGSSWRGIMYDHSTGKAFWVVLSSGNEVANTTDLSAFNARFEAVGF